MDCRRKPLANRKVRNYGAKGIGDFPVSTTNYRGPSPLPLNPTIFFWKVGICLFVFKQGDYGTFLESSRTPPSSDSQLTTSPIMS